MEEAVLRLKIAANAGADALLYRAAANKGALGVYSGRSGAQTCV